MDDRNDEHKQVDRDKDGGDEPGRYNDEQQLELKMRVQDIEHELRQMCGQMEKLHRLLSDLKRHIDPEGQAISDQQRLGG